MISFWMLATCECGIFARAHIEFCLYCIGDYAFVHIKVRRELGDDLTYSGHRQLKTTWQDEDIPGPQRARLASSTGVSVHRI